MRIFKLSAVATALLAVSSVYATAVTPVSWAAKTLNFASASVAPNNDIDLSVYKTSWAVETAYLGSISGILNITFDYSIRSDGWFELPFISATTNGAGNFSIPACTNDPSLAGYPSECGIPLGNNGGLIDIPTAYSTKSGSGSFQAEVNGDSWINFAIIPSWASNAGDHFNTYLEIRNLSFDVSPVAEPETYALMLAGLGAVGFMVRRRKKSI
jgi:hypothetical protein